LDLIPSATNSILSEYKTILILSPVLRDKSLENHLDLLQETRHRRILTKEEKQIKAGIENDLDELDRAIYDISAE
jgi:hypothetical protein